MTSIEGQLGDVALEDLIQEAVATYSKDEVDWEGFTELADAIGHAGVEGVETTAVSLSTGDPHQRFAAAELLGRMSVNAAPSVAERCYGVLAEALKLELEAASALQTPEVPTPEATLSANTGDAGAQLLASIVSALGHLEDPRAVPSLLGLVRHESEIVRFSLALALPAVCDEDYEAAVTDALVSLTSDDDEGVRDWACFGLSQMQIDTPGVRDALAVRLADSHDDARCEALIGLARLGDQRAFDMLIERLACDDVWTLEIEAAGELADTRFHPLLGALREWWTDDSDEDVVEFAMRRCDPKAAVAAAGHEQAFLNLLRTSEATNGLVVEENGVYPLTRVVIKEGNEVIDEFRLWDDEDPVTFDAARSAASQLMTLQQLIEPS